MPPETLRARPTLGMPPPDALQEGWSDECYQLLSDDWLRYGCLPALDELVKVEPVDEDACQPRHANDV